MADSKTSHPAKAISHFDIPGTCLDVKAYGNGHINDTYAAVFSHQGKRRRYILQRINSNVFSDVVGLMENIRRVCEHTQESLRLRGAADIHRRSLSLIHTRSGDVVHQDGHSWWRVYNFVENAIGYDCAESPQMAFEAAKAFGEFLGLLADLPGGQLNETIPDFHNTPSRYATLEKAIAEDRQGRASQCKDAIEFALSRRKLAHELSNLKLNGELSERATHNDTKLNNVLIDSRTKSAMCVIDLDTVMPGLAAYDFGDLVRTTISSAAEDERDITRIRVRTDIYERLVQGFLKGAGTALSAAEKSSLPIGAKAMTFENGIRFLTDHLAGDTYFKISRPNQNLDRCRAQFALLRSIEDHWGELEALTSQ